MKTYNKILHNLNILLAKNLDSYEATREIFNKSPNDTIEKFHRLIATINSDISKGRISDEFHFSEEEELNLFTLVLYYRLIRNLISIKCLIEYANPDDDHFDCTEYSIGILLRSSLLDCKLLYRSRTTSDLNKYHIDSFQKFLSKFRKKHKELIQQKAPSIELSKMERDIEFCSRIINILARKSTNDTPPLDSSKFQKELSFFADIENNCKDLYDIYSKYDHFSIYEISKIHWNREARIEAIHQSILLQIPALVMCWAVLGGIQLDTDSINEFGTWFHEGFEI